METEKNISPPLPMEPNVRQRKLYISENLLSQIKRSGYDPVEALTYFNTLIKENREQTNKLEAQNNKIAEALDNTVRLSAGYQAEVIKNRRLREAINRLRPQDYYEVIQKIEKGKGWQL
jgi:hypothetical protein